MSSEEQARSMSKARRWIGCRGIERHGEGFCGMTGKDFEERICTQRIFLTQQTQRDPLVHVKDLSMSNSTPTEFESMKDFSSNNKGLSGRA